MWDKEQIMHFTDNCEPPNQAGVVYKMSCNDCDVTYTLETGRQLKEWTEKYHKDVDKVKITSNVYHYVQSTEHSLLGHQCYWKIKYQNTKKSGGNPLI